MIGSSLTIVLMSCKGGFKTRKINSVKTSAKQRSWKSEAHSQKEEQQVNCRWGSGSCSDSQAAHDSQADAVTRKADLEQPTEKQQR